MAPRISLRAPPRLPPRIRLRALPNPWQQASASFPATYRRLYSTEDPLLSVTSLKAPGSGHIRILELNRPGARNAISRALLRALRTQLEDVASHYGAADAEELQPTPGTGNLHGPPRALILASAVDSVFCAGADLKERLGFSQVETQDFLDNLRSTLSLLEELPIPTISAISSVALGGGLELALATHLRVLTSNAVVGLPETRLGIIPGAGGTYRLPALVGISRARDLILTGRRVAAPEAYYLGIADRLVEVLPGETTEPGAPAADAKAKLLADARVAALGEAVRLALEICEGGPVALRAAIRAVASARPEVEDRMYERVIVTEDRMEALDAFKEKRKPVFKGR